ncbi:MAG TPA: DUF4389 domain-containing protein [Kofleriaceae bacterium]
MPAYPVQLDVSSPPIFDRMQLLVRLAIGVALGWLGVTLGWLWCLLFFALPVVAASVVSARGADYYEQNTAPRLWSALTWLLAFSAYMLFVIDRVPIDDHRVHTELRMTGRPSVGTSLARLVMSIPSAVALCFIGLVSCVLWVIALFSILLFRTVPASILDFQKGYLRWQARLAAFHASFIEEYPPFSFAARTPNFPTAMVNQ